VENIKVAQIDNSANDVPAKDISANNNSKSEITKEESLKYDISKHDSSANDKSTESGDKWWTTIRKLFPLTHLRDCFRTCFKVRPNHGRAVLIALMASSLLLMIISAGIQSCPVKQTYRE
jgi:hypothetical protein